MEAIAEFVAQHWMDVAFAVLWLVAGVGVQRLGDRLVRPRARGGAE
jgi:hypothetical protein